MSNQIFRCCCGRPLSRRISLVLHQKKCPTAALAEQEGRDTHTFYILPEPTVSRPSDNFRSLSTFIADEYDKGVTGNKSAARRARNAMLVMRKSILDMRKTLLVRNTEPTP